MSIAVIIVAAGKGSRMGGDAAKQWQDLAGRPVLDHTISRFEAALPDAAGVLVLPADDLARGAAWPRWTAVAGGDSRAGSVRAGLAALDADTVSHVLIHDAARPLVPVEVIARVVAALQAGAPAAAPGLALADALWRVEDGRITGTAPRDGLWRAQTPQGFALEAIRAAHDAPGAAEAADDVAVALAAGLPVTAVAGDADNFKLTVPADMTRAARLLEDRMDLRVGQGFDVHAFDAPSEGAMVTLCGVEIPHAAGLSGHSDADVGLHALCDAIYGALAEGDIGRHFPPSDEEWRGADSMVFLDHAVALVKERGYRIANVDVTLICERPKIGPHAAAMQARLAPALGIGTDRISVKATTSEKLGFTGRGEGIAALAVATLVQP